MKINRLLVKLIVMDLANNRASAAAAIDSTVLAAIDNSFDNSRFYSEKQSIIFLSVSNAAAFDSFDNSTLLYCEQQSINFLRL